MTSQISYLAEVFLLNVERLPNLVAFRLEIAQSADLNTIGGKLARQLTKRVGGRWAWSRSMSQVLGERQDFDTASLLKDLWSEQRDTFGSLRDIQGTSVKGTTSMALAEFAVNAILDPARREVRKALTLDRPIRLGSDVELVREPDVRAWVVQDRPAVSISIRSRLLCRRSLQEFAEGGGEDLLGMQVTDKARQHTAEVDEVLEGNLAVHRDRLIALATRKESQEELRAAPDSTLVVKIRNRGSANGYEYPATALLPVVRSADFAFFGVNGSQARKQMVLPPGLRAELVNKAKKAFNTATDALIGPPFHSGLAGFSGYLTAEDLGYSESVKLGSSAVVIHDHKSIFREVKSHGPYSGQPTRSNPIRIGVLTLPGCEDWQRFEGDLLRILQEVSCPSAVTQRAMARSSSRRELEAALASLEGAVDLVLLVLPEDETQDDSEEGSGAYIRFKAATIPRDLASQAVQLKTLENSRNASIVLENVALGIMAKAGTVPFVLAEPLPYADIVVGLDIARKQKDKLAGSINAAATARIYNTQGEFLRYWLPDHLIEGETIPADLLERMFPEAQFRGKRVLIHRDGLFRGREKEALTEWGASIGAGMMLVEVIKSGAPRLYSYTSSSNVSKPPKGLCLKISDSEAILVSSPPPFGDATPRPLQVRTHGGITIEQACHSVLSLTLVHIGSKLCPRLPVTIHWADQIAEFALKNIKPRSLEGDRPFWL